MQLTIIRDDITKLHTDAIVNAANTNLQMGGGVCGAIFTAAGADRLQAACEVLAPIKTGEAVITRGFALPAKYIIHTAGPVYRDGHQGEEALLCACYKNALDLAKKHDCESVAFPLISSGIYGYPKDQALAVATGAIGQWLMDDDISVSLVVFDKTAFSLSRELLGEVKTFIDQNYVDESAAKARRRMLDAESVPIRFEDAADQKMKPTAAMPMPVSAVMREKKPADVFGQLDEPFPVTLLRLIDRKGKTDVEVYKCANIDRKLFSKIRTGKGYMPSKKTIIALAVAVVLYLTIVAHE